MKNVFIIWAYLLIIMFVSCSRKQDNNVVSIPANGNIKDVISFSSIFDSYRIIRLETRDSQLPGNYSVCIGKRNLTFLSGSNVQKILVFNKDNGDYVNGFCKYGRGPKEYFYINAINTLNDDSIIEVFSGPLKKFIRYSEAGEFIEEINVPVQTGFSYIHSGENRIWLFSSYGFTNRNLNRLACLDFNDPKNNKFLLKLDPKYDYQSFAMNNMFNPVDNCISFHFPLDNKIYHIINDTLFPKYSINYGKYGISPEIFEKNYRDVRQFTEALFKGNFRFNFGDIYEMSNHIIIRSYFRDDPFYTVFCKATKNVVLFKRLLIDFLPDLKINDAFLDNIRILGCENNNIYIELDPIQLARYYKIHLNKNKKGGEKNLKGDASNMKDVLRNMSMMDNPFILICKLREF